MSGSDVRGQQRFNPFQSALLRPGSDHRPPRHRSASDIDLTLIGQAISLRTLALIEAELDDLLLPWMIDLSRLADLSHPPLLAPIERVGPLLYRRGNGPD